YGSDYGLTSDRTRDVEADWNVQVSPAIAANLFASLERHNRAMQGIHGIASSSNGDAGGPNFPFSNQWGVHTHGDATGWGGVLPLNRTSWVQLDTRYTFLVTREVEDLAFAGATALAAPAGVPIPDRMPKLRSRDHALETSLRFALRKSIGLRFFYRYERSGV